MKRVIIFIVLILWATFTASGFAQSPGQIVYATSESGAWELWRLDPNTLATSRIVTVGGTGISGISAVAWSPDGNKITFSSNATGPYEIYVVNAGGSDLRQVTTDGANWPDCGNYMPCWVDNEYLLYSTRRVNVGQREIARIKTDGTEQQVLTNLGGTHDSYMLPWLSPERTRLTFAKGIPYWGASGKIYVADYPTFANQQLVGDVNGNNSGDSNPVWSSNGLIAFQADAGSNATNIYTVRPDGSGLTNISLAPGVSDCSPHFSPDGSKIAFLSNQSGVYNIWVMNVDGTDRRQLTFATDPNVIGVPDWGGGFGSISGTVSDSLGGVLGVAVDLFDSTGSLTEFTYTDVNGFFEFDSVDAGDNTVSIVTPLGYVADFESMPVTVTINADSVVNFTLHRLEIVPSQRSMGYWKHQVNVHLSGRGHAQEALADMSNYMSLIGEHFNNNLANPITIFEVPQPAEQTDSLEALQNLLTVKGNAGMNAKAKQQLIALMLNVVSLKLHQTTPISEDSATVSQAITYCNQLITDSGSTNDEIAKDIADNINNGVLVASGVIPLTTPNIIYKGEEDQITQTPNVPKEFSLEQNYPNPFNPVCNIEYALPIDCQVTLNIFNILGQKVRLLVEEYQSAGKKSAKWDGKDDQGQEVTSGVYFYRIQAGDFVQSKKMVLIK